IKFNDTQRSFVTYFRIVLKSEDPIHALQYMFSMGICLSLKQLRIPVLIELVRTAQVTRIGNIAPLGEMPGMESNALMIIIYFHTGIYIVYHGLFSYETVWHAIIALVGREVDIAHLLHLCHFIVLDFIRFIRKTFEILSLDPLVEFDPA